MFQRRQVLDWGRDYQREWSEPQGRDHGGSEAHPWNMWP